MRNSYHFGHTVGAMVTELRRGSVNSATGWWRFVGFDAQRILKEEFEIDCSLSSTNRLLHRIKLRWVGTTSAPPGGRCDGASGVFATLGLQLERVRAAQGRGTRVEVWFQDEARIGQKNKLTRVWGQTGSRPAAPKDLGFASAYVFGAVCPVEGKAAALIMPVCNTAAMNHHLSEISSQVAAPRFREGRLYPCRGDPRSRRVASKPRTRGARQYHFAGAAAVQPG